MAPVAERERALAPAPSALPAQAPVGRPEGKPGQLIPPYELALADFARHLSLSARQRTAGAYLDTLQRVVAFQVDPLQAERGDLERFLARGRRGRWGDWEGSLSTSTQTAELAALRRFYSWTRAEGLRADDPSQGIRPPRREPYARARGLSAEEVAKLLAAIPDDSSAGLRLRALVLAYLLTGRRRSEVLNLRWRDLDLEGGFYRYTGKGGKERQRALPPPVRLAILVYAEAAGLERRPEEAVFPGRWRDQPVDGKYIGEQLRQTAQLAGITLERPLHTLRHSYARALRRVEAPLEAVQAALDHSNLATTSIYLRQLEGQEDPWWPKLAAELGLEVEAEAEASSAPGMRC
ncbi:MAG: tyrosine-type recombinase/integrase [Candidatus Dormibacteraeota bacterium]|nr:tyrosine-type recombinase/integrase [Candidatus Dormibacteraeota bacterium]MDQ6900845.1 tyrosine-type recombinase/integrase [Candidatus Dormibacteraeota bacterium]